MVPWPWPSGAKRGHLARFRTLTSPKYYRTLGPRTWNFTCLIYLNNAQFQRRLMGVANSGGEIFYDILCDTHMSAPKLRRRLNYQRRVIIMRHKLLSFGKREEKKICKKVCRSVPNLCNCIIYVNNALYLLYYLHTCDVIILLQNCYFQSEKPTFTNGNFAARLSHWSGLVSHENSWNSSRKRKRVLKWLTGKWEITYRTDFQ